MSVPPAKFMFVHVTCIFENLIRGAWHTTLWFCGYKNVRWWYNFKSVCGCRKIRIIASYYQVCCSTLFLGNFLTIFGSNCKFSKTISWWTETKWMIQVIMYSNLMQHIAYPIFQFRKREIRITHLRGFSRNAGVT